MAPELIVLILSAASIAFLHTLLGPDHYLPFIAMARARGWSLSKTLRVVLLCGSGHLVGSVVLGAIGIGVGLELTRLEWVETLRGDIAAWAYAAWERCTLFGGCGMRIGNAQNTGPCAVRTAT